MSNQPNIIVFLTDDHGPWAANCCGTKSLYTPAMDQLAATGARMTRAVTPSPVCSPARACFFTGRLPSQHGIHDYIERDVLPEGHRGLKDETNLGQLLQQAGYETAMIGKWHCGETWNPAPGFDHWFTHQQNQGPNFGDIKLTDNGNVFDFHGYQSELFADKAIDVIRNKADKPLFIFVGLIDTHTPYSLMPERLVEHYRKHDFSDVPREAFSDAHGKPFVDMDYFFENYHEHMAQYFASVTFIDEQIGRVMDTLQGEDELNNSLFIYTSDHGHNNGHHGIHCKGNATTPQNFLDESITVPLMISWPKQIEAGKVHDIPVDHCDLFNTLLDAAGTQAPEAVNSPGSSYLPRLKGQADQPWRDAQFCEYGNARCIRTATHKWIKRYPGPNGMFPDELYDLQADPRETKNVAGDAAYAEIQSHLQEQLEAHFAKYDTEQYSGITIGEQIKVNPYAPWDREGDFQHRI